MSAMSQHADETAVSHIGPGRWTSLPVDAWNIGDNRGVEVRGELFNIFDEQEPLTISRTAVSTFGDPLTRQLPRTARLFARFSF